MIYKPECPKKTTHHSCWLRPFCQAASISRRYLLGNWVQHWMHLPWSWPCNFRRNENPQRVTADQQVLVWWWISRGIYMGCILTMCIYIYIIYIYPYFYYGDTISYPTDCNSWTLISVFGWTTYNIIYIYIYISKDFKSCLSLFEVSTSSINQGFSIWGLSLSNMEHTHPANMMASGQDNDEYMVDMYSIWG